MDIAPFPSGIDRDAFGHWLSGFTDGEGSFCLTWARPNPGRNNRSPRASFAIRVRDDDLPIIQLICSYFGTGHLSRGRASGRGNRKPSAGYVCNGIAGLIASVVPHFELYPLRAKKRLDFEIWKEAVLLMGTVISRPRKSLGHSCGQKCRWSESDRNQFENLRKRLCEIRKHPSRKTEALEIAFPFKNRKPTPELQ